MKKLMIAASAALCATVGFSDVTSANIVGYNNAGLRDFGNAITASFLGVGATDTFKLNDIKITGYEDDEEVKTRGGLINLEFSFALLDYGGFTMDDDAFGFWYREYNLDSKSWEDGYWFYNYEPADDSVTFNAGEGFWFTSMSAPKDDGGDPTATYKFVNSGAVDQNDRNYKLRDFGNLVGNPMPATVNLSDLTITGYEDNEEVKVRGGLINLEFSFALLDYGGFTMDDDAFGFWYEDCIDGKWQGGYWFFNYEPVVPGEVDLPLPPGQAMWLTAMSAPKGEDEKPLETYYLQFPTPVPAAAK